MTSPLIFIKCSFTYPLTISKLQACSLSTVYLVHAWSIIHGMNTPTPMFWANNMHNLEKITGRDTWTFSPSNIGCEIWKKERKVNYFIVAGGGLLSHMFYVNKKLCYVYIQPYMRWVLFFPLLSLFLMYFILHMINKWILFLFSLWFLL